MKNIKVLFIFEVGYNRYEYYGGMYRTLYYVGWVELTIVIGLLVC